MGSVTIDRLPISAHTTWAESTQTAVDREYNAQVAPPTAYHATSTISSEWNTFFSTDMGVPPVALFPAAPATVLEKIQCTEWDAISTLVADQQELFSCVEQYRKIQAMRNEVDCEIIRVQKP